MWENTQSLRSPPSLRTQNQRVAHMGPIRPASCLVEVHVPPPPAFSQPGVHADLCSNLTCHAAGKRLAVLASAPTRFPHSSFQPFLPQYMFVSVREKGRREFEIVPQ